VADFLFAVFAARDDGLDAELAQEGAEGIAVVTFVGQKLFDAGNETDAGFGQRAFDDVAGRQDKNPRPAKLVDDRVNLAVFAAFGQADRLNLRPPFPPPAQRWALTCVASSAARSGVRASAATLSKIFAQMPRSLHRAKRL